MASPFQLGHETESGAPFHPGQSFSLSMNNNGNIRRRLVKVRKLAHRPAHPSSSALNSIDPIASKSTSDGFFASGQVSGFSVTNPFKFKGCEVDKVSDREKPIETASKLQHENVEPRVGEKEKSGTREMAVLGPSHLKQDKIARQANQDSIPNTALMVISRILKGIPQSPHFCQLRNHSEHTRKVLISSWDRIFRETVEQIQSLQVNGFWVRARELWKAMGELQSMGYNVIPLRKRLLELTDVMTELKQTELGIKGLMIKAENHVMEKSRLEDEILLLQGMIKKEHDGMVGALAQKEEMEKKVPKLDGVFAELAMQPL